MDPNVTKTNSEVQLWIQSSASAMPTAVVSNVKCSLVCKASKLKIEVLCHMLYDVISQEYSRREIVRRKKISERKC